MVILGPTSKFTISAVTAVVCLILYRSSKLIATSLVTTITTSYTMALCYSASSGEYTCSDPRSLVVVGGGGGHMTHHCQQLLSNTFVCRGAYPSPPASLKKEQTNEQANTIILKLHFDQKLDDLLVVITASIITVQPQVLVGSKFGGWAENLCYNSICRSGSSYISV